LTVDAEVQGEAEGAEVDPVVLTASPAVSGVPGRSTSSSAATTAASANARDPRTVASFVEGGGADEVAATSAVGAGELESMPASG
jgi:hypothetical protein